MPPAIVGIGSNLGTPANHIKRAVDILSRSAEYCLVKTSSFVHTRAAGGPPHQPDFLNAAALLETELDPTLLVRSLLAVEAKMGRTRQARWAARTVDLDLLCYGDAVLSTETAKIPHPWLCIRRFALRPAAEVAPNQLHPILRMSMLKLWQRLDDQAGWVVILVKQPADHEWGKEAVIASNTQGGFVHGLPGRPDGSIPRSLLEFPGCALMCRENPLPGTELVPPFSVRAYIVLDTESMTEGLATLPDWLGPVWDQHPAPAVWLDVADRQNAKPYLRHAFQAMTE